MKIRLALKRANDRLAGHRDIEIPELESEVLLRHILKMDRVQLFLHLEKELDSGDEAKFQKLIERRLQGEPLAYIIHHREFFGLDFYVDERVLIPRPESELLVEEAIKFAQQVGASTIADIGTGSGSIAVSLAIHLPKVKIFATDISQAALDVARINSEKHAVLDNIILLPGDLLEPLPTQVDIIVANLPYVTDAEVTAMASAKYEPSLALRGGEYGLEQITRISFQIKEKLRPGGCILLEIGQGQSQNVRDLFRQLFSSEVIEVIPDLSGIDRVIRIVFSPDILS